MKGSGDAVFTLTIILFVMLMLSLLIFVVSSEHIKRNEIILSDKELLSTKNTFYLLNRSLAFTWYISSVQSVFRAMDDSIGCGIDDVSNVNVMDELPPLYWYRYDPESTKSGKFSPRLPSQKKYNWVDTTPSEFNPKICYPQRLDEAETDALDYIKNQYEPYKKIPGSGVDEIKITGGIKARLRNIELDSLKFNEDGLVFEASENINVESSNTKIFALEKHVTQVYTQLEKMLKMARKAVEFVFIEISDRLVHEQAEPLRGGKFDLSKRYLDIGVTDISLQPAKSKNDYIQNFKDDMKTRLDNIAQDSDFSGNYALKFRKAELFASQPMGSVAFGAKCVNSACVTPSNAIIGPCRFDTDCGDFSQLILHYDASVIYSEGSASASISMPVPSDIEAFIKLEVENREWKFGSIVYEENEIAPLIAAIIMQESAFDRNAVSDCGAAGIMQFIPDTARDNGLNVPVYSFETCNIALCQMQVSACNACTPDKCDKTADQRFSPGLSISAGISYTHALFWQMAPHTPDKENLIKLVIASYNAGPGTVSSAAAGNYDYDSFKNKLPQQTQDYVPAVLGYYAQYGGSVSNSQGFYYYHQDSSNRFYPKPFSMEQRAEDYLPAIDCTDSPYGEFDTGNPVTYNSIVRAHRWYPEGDANLVCFCGQLWSCNADVPNLPAERSLLTGDDVTPPSEACRQSLVFIGASKIACTSLGFGTLI